MYFALYSIFIFYKNVSKILYKIMELCYNVITMFLEVLWYGKYV